MSCRLSNSAEANAIRTAMRLRVKSHRRIDCQVNLFPSGFADTAYEAKLPLPAAQLSNKTPVLSYSAGQKLAYVYFEDESSE